MEFLMYYLGGFSAGIIPAAIFFLLIGAWISISDVCEEIVK